MIAPSRRKLLLATGALLAGGAAGIALYPPGFEELPPARVFAPDGLAIRGYDPVAYFKQEKPVRGDPGITVDWGGATWQFASTGNRDAFLASPASYAPQYGGFCAWAVAAKGKLYSTQPENWTIHDGKLYLNYNDSIQQKWESDIPGFIAEGDRRWPMIAMPA